MKRISLLNALIVGISVFSVAYYVINAWKYVGHATMDDAWMFMRYAKHYLDGAGFSWNAQDGPTYGTTSILYLLLITTIRGLTHWPDSMVLAGTSFFFGLSACLGLAFMGFLLDEKKSIRSYWMPLLVIPGVLLMPVFRYHSLSGMETTLSFFTITFLACFTILWSNRQTGLRFFLCILSSYLCFLARPDNGLYALLFPPLYLFATNQKSWSHAIRYIVILIAILMLDFGIKQVFLGSYVPLSFFAKSTGFYKGYLGITKWNAMTELILFWSTALPYAVFIIFLSNRRSAARLIAIGIPVLLIFIYYAQVVQIMGYNARFYYPALPFFVMAAFVSISSYEETINMSHRPPLGRTSIIVVALLLVSSDRIGNNVSMFWQTRVIGNPAGYNPRTHYAKSSRNDLPELAWSHGVNEIVNLLQRMPSDVIFAASEYGVLGAKFPNTTFIDLIGLNDKHIAYNGFSADYIMSRKPDIIWFPDPDYTFETVEILDNEIFAREYEYYPNAYNYGIALRKTSRLFPSINSIFEEEFSRIYPGLKMANYRAQPAYLSINE